MIKKLYALLMALAFVVGAHAGVTYELVRSVADINGNDSYILVSGSPFSGNKFAVATGYGTNALTCSTFATEYGVLPTVIESEANIKPLEFKITANTNGTYQIATDSKKLGSRNANFYLGVLTATQAFYYCTIKARGDGSFQIYGNNNANTTYSFCFVDQQTIKCYTNNVIGNYNYKYIAIYKVVSDGGGSTTTKTEVFFKFYGTTGNVANLVLGEDVVLPTVTYEDSKNNILTLTESDLVYAAVSSNDGSDNATDLFTVDSKGNVTLNSDGKTGTAYLKISISETSEKYTTGKENGAEKPGYIEMNISAPVTPTAITVVGDGNSVDICNSQNVEECETVATGSEYTFEGHGYYIFGAEGYEIVSAKDANGATIELTGVYRNNNKVLIPALVIGTDVRYSSLELTVKKLPVLRVVLEVESFVTLRSQDFKKTVDTLTGDATFTFERLDSEYYIWESPGQYGRFDEIKLENGTRIYPEDYKYYETIYRVIPVTANTELYFEIKKIPVEYDENGNEVSIKGAETKVMFDFRGADKFNLGEGGVVTSKLTPSVTITMSEAEHNVDHMLVAAGSTLSINLNRANEKASISRVEVNYTDDSEGILTLTKPDNTVMDDLKGDGKIFTVWAAKKPEAAPRSRAGENVEPTRQVVLTAGSQPARISTMEVHSYDVTTGIETVEVVKPTDVKWFDLQGRRVANPRQGGLYIRVMGTTVDKVIVK